MIVALGDSLTKGFDGFNDLYTSTYPQELSQILNEKVINQGFDGATLSGPYLGDMTSQIKNTHFQQYRGVILFYGTNDYGHSRNDLKAVAKVLKKGLRYIRKQEPAINIYGVLPLTRYDQLKNDDNRKGPGGYTFRALLKILEYTYQKASVPVLNWERDPQPLIGDQNFKQRLNDNHLHPTKETYRLMARRIAKFIKNQN